MSEDMCDPHDAEYAADTYLNCTPAAPASNAEGWPLDPSFPSKDEIDNIYDLISGYTELHFPLIPYRNLLTTECEIDEVHGETIESQKRWSDVISVRVFAVPSEYTQPGSVFGIEEDRIVDLLIAVPDLLEANLGTQNPVDFDITLVARIGDKYFYHKREYVVTAIVPAEFWANTDLPLYYHVRSELQRGSSVDDWGI